MFPTNIKTVSGLILLDDENHNETVLDYTGSQNWTLLSIRTWGDQLSGELIGNPLYVTAISDDITFLNRIVPVLESTLSGTYIDYPPTQFFPYQEFSDDIIIGVGALSLVDPVGYFGYQLTYIEEPYASSSNSMDISTPDINVGIGFILFLLTMFFFVWFFRSTKS